MHPCGCGDHVFCDTTNVDEPCPRPRPCRHFVPSLSQPLGSNPCAGTFPATPITYATATLSDLQAYKNGLQGFSASQAGTLRLSAVVMGDNGGGPRGPGQAANGPALTDSGGNVEFVRVSSVQWGRSVNRLQGGVPAEPDAHQPCTTPHVQSRMHLMTSACTGFCNGGNVPGRPGGYLCRQGAGQAILYCHCGGVCTQAKCACLPLVRGSVIRPPPSHTHTHACTRTHMHARARTRTHTHARARTHTHAHARMQTWSPGLRDATATTAMPGVFSSLLLARTSAGQLGTAGRWPADGADGALPRRVVAGVSAQHRGDTDLAANTALMAVVNVTLVNFTSGAGGSGQQQPAYAFVLCARCQPFRGGSTTHVSGLRFVQQSGLPSLAAWSWGHQVRGAALAGGPGC
jgi:hypothetical protein